MTGHTPFRRRNAQALYESHYGPNMTPMVDVVMVILIFFMASTAFLGPEWFLKTSLPVTSAGPAPAIEPTRLKVILTIGPEGRTAAAVGGVSALDMAALDTFLKETAERVEPENVVVLISPSPDVPYDDVVRVHETCARLLISKVGLVEQAPPPEAPPSG